MLKRFSPNHSRQDRLPTGRRLAPGPCSPTGGIGARHRLSDRAPSRNPLLAFAPPQLDFVTTRLPNPVHRLRPAAPRPTPIPANPPPITTRFPDLVTTAHVGNPAPVPPPRLLQPPASSAPPRRPEHPLCVLRHRSRMLTIRASSPAFPTGRLSYLGTLDRDMVSEPELHLDDQIVTLVRQFWTENSRPLLLSQLGGQDSGNIAKRAREEAGGLGAYVRTRLSDRVRVLQHSTKPTLIGVIPLDEDIPTDDSDELLNQTQTQSDKTTFRLHPAFWAAFRKPLDDSLRRYMSTQPPLHFKDVRQEIQSSDFIEIAHEYIVAADAEATTVQQTITKWLADNGLDAAAFGRANRPTPLPSDDLLGRLLLALEPEELKRRGCPGCC